MRTDWEKIGLLEGLPNESDKIKVSELFDETVRVLTQNGELNDGNVISLLSIDTINSTNSTFLPLIRRNYVKIEVYDIPTLFMYYKFFCEKNKYGVEMLAKSTGMDVECELIRMFEEKAF